MRRNMYRMGGIGTGKGKSTQVLKSPSSLISLDRPDNLGSLFHPPSSTFAAANKKGAIVIDGKLIADEIRSTIAIEVGRMKESIVKVPGLPVIVVGQRKESQTHVRNKMKACEEAGIKSLITQLPNDCPEGRVLDAMSHHNGDPSVHGILVQLPLPRLILSTAM